MNVSFNYLEFDVTPHLESSARVDEHGVVTDVSITLFPFGDFEQRIYGGNLQPNPSTIIMSLEEAEVLARLLTGAVKDARNGQYDKIDREYVDNS
ncbi:hypothetical protein EB74_24370 [Mycobacterium sp. SWH-M5]|nr:hypothetical protein EB74_24370 [Mycobacterium sp. SWH-M5]